MFSKLDEKKWPHHIDNGSAEIQSRLLCETEIKFRNDPPKWNEEISIRHHRMTIVLAMPDRGKR